MSSVLQWGTPPVSPPPASAIAVIDGLQPFADALASVGGEIQIGEGDYYGDPANPATPLVLPAGVSIVGVGLLASRIGSPIQVNGDDCSLRDLCVNPAGGSYNLSASGFRRLRLLRTRFLRDAGSVANLVVVAGATLTSIEDCVFAISGAFATAALSLDSDGGVLEGNSFDGWGAVAVVSIPSTASDIRIGPNAISGGGRIEDLST